MGEHAEGPDVGGRADPAAAFADLRPQQLGRGVVGGGEGRGVGVGALQLSGHVEVGEPGRAVRHQQHVGRFEIPVHPARPVQLGQSLADLREQGGPGGRAGRGGEQGGQGGLGSLQYEDGGAVEGRALRVVDDEGLVHPDQPRPPEPTVQVDLTLDEFAQVGQLAWGARAGGQELQGGGPGQVGADGVLVRLVRADAGGGAAGAPARVHAAESTRRDRLAHLPDADPVAPGHRHGVRLGHRAARLAGADSTTRSSSRTRSKRSARETSDSFLPLRRGPVSAVSGPGLSRSFTAR